MQRRQSDVRSQDQMAPTVAGRIAQLSEEEDDCFDSSKDAAAAAKRFRDEARAKLHEEFAEP